MSQINIKSISGITSITTPAGVDNQLTLHTNNTNQAFKLDHAGNLHFNNHVNITGVSSASNFKTGTTDLHSLGLTAASADIDDFVSVGSNIHLGNAGIITASSYRGDGSQLTGITGTIINNQSDNRMITCTGTSNTLNAEQYLTYTSQSSLNLTDGNGTSILGGNYLLLKRTTANTNYINAPLNNADLVISADRNLLFHTVHTADYNSTERVRITEAGLVGVGQASPTHMLHVDSSNASDSTATAFFKGRIIRFDGAASAHSPRLNFSLDGTDKAQILLHRTNVGLDIATLAAEPIKFKINSAEKLRIDTNGKLLVGTSSATSLGSHTGASNVSTFNQSGITLTQYGVTAGFYYDRLNFTNSQYFIVNASNTGVYLGNGATSWTGYSDERMKTNITELDGTKAYNHIKTARATSFKWNATGYPTDTKIGFIAQDWETNYPEVVNSTTETIDSVENPKGIQYTETVPVLMAALKQAITKIETLEQENIALRVRVTNLEGN